MRQDNPIFQGVLVLTDGIIRKYRLYEMVNWFLTSKRNREMFLQDISTTLLLRDIADLEIASLRDILSAIDPRADQYSCEAVSAGPYEEFLRKQVASALARMIAIQLDYSQSNPLYPRWKKAA